MTRAAVLAWQAPASHAEWRELLTGGFFRLLTMLFAGALLYHAWVGMRDILMDYVKHAGLRLAHHRSIGWLNPGILNYGNSSAMRRR